MVDPETAAEDAVVSSDPGADPHAVAATSRGTTAAMWKAEVVVVLGALEFLILRAPFRNECASPAADPTRGRLAGLSVAESRKQRVFPISRSLMHRMDRAERGDSSHLLDD